MSNFEIEAAVCKNTYSILFWVSFVAKRSERVLYFMALIGRRPMRAEKGRKDCCKYLLHSAVCGLETRHRCMH